MVLNDDGVPCLRVGEYEQVGTRKEVVDTIKKKWGRGWTEVPVFKDAPIYKKIIKLIPAVERGWTKEVVFEVPRYNNRAGRWQLWQYRVSADSFRCSACKTNKHTLVMLVGWSYERYPTLPHHGGGVVTRCFKCDITKGPIDPSEYGEERIIKDTITKKEAIEVVRKYGLDVPIEGLAR